MQRARIFGLQANMKAALAELDKAHELEPGNLAVLLLRAGVWQDLGEKAKPWPTSNASWNSSPTCPRRSGCGSRCSWRTRSSTRRPAGLEKLRQQNPKDEAVLLNWASLSACKRNTTRQLTFISAALAKIIPTSGSFSALAATPS